MNVKDLLCDTLLAAYPAFPVRLQGSISDTEEYPDHFFTFFNNDTVGHRFYDNSENATIWDFDLNFYSIDPELVNSVLNEAKIALENAGWIIDGKGHDVVSGEPTHTGRGINILYIENNRGNKQNG